MTDLKRFPVQASLLWMLSLISAVAAAQENDARSAADVLDRYVEALGGEMALQSLEGAEYEGTIEGGVLTGTFAFLHEQGKVAIKIEWAGQPVTRLGFDGEYIWQQQGGVGFKRRAERFFGLGVDLPGTPMTALEWLERKDEATLLESTQVGDRPAHVIRIEMPEGQTVRGYFDQESGLLIQATYGEGETATEYRLEYASEPIEGLRFVNKATASIAGNTRFVWTVSNIVANPELDGDEFQIPDGLIEGEPGGG